MGEKKPAGQKFTFEEGGESSGSDTGGIIKKFRTKL